MAPGKAGISGKRVVKELAELDKETPEGIRLGLKNESNLFEWYAQIKGPDDSVYEGGVFDIDISIPPDYPFRAPRAQFKTKVYHMNVNKDGAICLDILKTQWSPALSVLKVVLSILSLLTDPNPSDPLVGEIAQLYQRNRPQHDKNAKEWTKLHAKPENASPPVLDNGKSTASSSSSTSTSAPKEKQKEKPASSRAPRNTTGERPIIIDGDDDEVQIVGVKRSAPDSSTTNARSTRARTSNANNASGSGSSSNNVIELD